MEAVLHNGQEKNGFKPDRHEPRQALTLTTFMDLDKGLQLSKHQDSWSNGEDTSNLFTGHCEE